MGETKDNTPPIEDKLSVTRHKVTIGGVEVSYTVTAGTLVLREETDKDGEQDKASLFFVAYTRDGVENVADRPLTFAFNGGPGSSSVWLHLGLLGPRRIMTDAHGKLSPPYRLTDNAYSLLDKSDLVFIDPIGTGFSRAVVGEEAKQFHNFKKDIESVGRFILLYLGRYKRWSSAKFLGGESYGTTRACGLAHYLQEKHGLYLNGIVLVSAVLDFQTLLFEHGNDLPYLLFLPSYAATALYHGKVQLADGQDLLSFLTEVREFVLGDYASALLRGTRLDTETRDRVAQRLAHYSGLSKRYVERSNLRIEHLRFCKELLRDKGRTVGRFDGREVGIDRDEVGEKFEYDPSASSTQGAYTAALNAYVREELEFTSDLPYEVINMQVYKNWKYDEHQNKYVNVAESLRKTMNENPALKIFIANGYYDIATPFMATEYTFDHLGLDKSLQDNIDMTYYHGGHMMYTDEDELARMKQDLDRFYSATFDRLV